MQFWCSVSFQDIDRQLDLARWCDELGYEGVLVADHLAFPETIDSPYPYSSDGSPFWQPTTPWPDPWVTIGALAAVTTRLRFSTNIYIAPARPALVVAKAVSTAAVISHGRVALGAGVGWMREEFDAAGQDFATRGKRTDELFDVCRLLWSGEMVEYHGRFHDFPRMQISPVPSAPIPIWVGGDSEVALRRAARNDGWIGSVYPVEGAIAQIEKLQAFRREAGTAEAPFEILVALNGRADDLDAYRRLDDAGVTGIMTSPHMSAKGPDDARGKLEAFAERVLAKL